MPRIIACYVVANEADIIAESLRSVKAYVDGYVIVDSLFETNPAEGTHSSDGTMAIAERVCAPKPLTYILSRERLTEPKARNLYLDHTLGEWILVMDGDEQLYGQHSYGMGLMEDIRHGNYVDGIGMPVYTVAVNFNGNAPEMTPEDYETAPLISTMGHQARLLENSAERGLRYRETDLGIGHVAFEKDGAFARASRETADLFVINHHTRQSFASYLNDYAWERAAIDQAKR